LIRILETLSASIVKKLLIKSHGTEDDLKIQIDDNLENSMSFELNSIDNIGVGTSSSTNIHNIGVGISNDTIILLMIMILMNV
jgi:hypothetical protein